MSHATPTSDGAEPELKYYFVRRPVMAAVISIVITLLGLFALQRLPINRYPQITPPAVERDGRLPRRDRRGRGARRGRADRAAAVGPRRPALLPVGQFVRRRDEPDGVLRHLARTRTWPPSTCRTPSSWPSRSCRKRCAATVSWCRRRRATSSSQRRSTPTTRKFDAAYLTNYAKLNIEDEIKRIPGVGSARVFGQLEFSMTISVDPDRLAQLGLTIGDVSRAVREQSTTNPAGRLGREPAPTGTQFTIPVTAQGRLTTPEEFGDVILRADHNGSLVRVKDVATVALSSRNYDQVARLDGKPTTFILVNLRNGANALDVRELFETRMNELQKSFPPGVKWTMPYDTTPFIQESIVEVVKTLAEAMLLVTLVVFLFLQSWRATLIPVLAVPVSVIGTFVGLLMLGFSVNVLTLFGLVLAIGIVVDDAIVVIENVERIMAEEKVSARVAADQAMGQVGGALVAIVLVLCAVFIPVAFLGGITGEMYKQFAVTIVLSVVLSGIVALTLTPALCAMLLKEAVGSHDEDGPRFFAWFNRSFAKATSRYTNAVSGIITRPRTTLAVFAVLVVLIGVLYRHVPKAFIPPEDKGFFAIGVQLPDGASKQRTEEVVAKIEEFLLKDPGIRHASALVGLDALSFAAQTNSAIIFVNLKPWDERTTPDLGIDAIVGRANGQLWAHPRGAGVRLQLPRDPRPRHHLGTRAEPAGAGGAVVSRSSPRRSRSSSATPTSCRSSAACRARSGPTCRSCG